MDNFSNNKLVNSVYFRIFGYVIPTHIGVLYIFYTKQKTDGYRNNRNFMMNKNLLLEVGKGMINPINQKGNFNFQILSTKEETVYEVLDDSSLTDYTFTYESKEFKKHNVKIRIETKVNGKYTHYCVLGYQKNHQSRFKPVWFYDEDNETNLIDVINYINKKVKK